MSGLPTNVSTRDLEIIAVAWKTSKTPIQVDFQALADAGYYKNAHSARSNFDKVKKSVFDDSVASETTSQTPKKTATPRKRKGKAADGPATPMPTAKTTGGEDNYEEDNNKDIKATYSDGESPSKKVKAEV